MKNRIRIGDKVMGIMGLAGGYAGTVTAIKSDGRNTVVFFVDDDGATYETLDSNITKNVPEKGKFPRKNPRRGNDDPSREEMIEHIRKVYGRDADEFDIEEAIYWFANDYHGGQSSNLYSALSTSEYRPGRSSSGPEEGSMGEMIYADLVDTFSTKKNPLKRRKGESVRDFTSRCMSEEKMSFPKTKQRIAVCLSKSRKRNPLESGASISDDEDINARASNMG